MHDNYTDDTEYVLDMGVGAPYRQSTMDSILLDA